MYEVVGMSPSDLEHLTWSQLFYMCVYSVFVFVSIFFFFFNSLKARKTSTTKLGN